MNGLELDCDESVNGDPNKCACTDQYGRKGPRTSQRIQLAGHRSACSRGRDDAPSPSSAGRCRHRRRHRPRHRSRPSHSTPRPHRSCCRPYASGPLCCGRWRRQHEGGWPPSPPSHAAAAAAAAGGGREGEGHARFHHHHHQLLMPLLLLLLLPPIATARAPAASCSCGRPGCCVHTPCGVVLCGPLLAAAAGACAVN